MTLATSSVIVTVAVAVPAAATDQPVTPLAGAIVTVKVSPESAKRSDWIGTEIVAVVRRPAAP